MRAQSPAKAGGTPHLRVYDLHVTDRVSTDKEAVRLELQEALVSFRQQATLGVQVAGFMATADALLLIAGFAQHRSGIFLLASFAPILLFIIYVELLKYALPVGYVAMALERELGLSNAPLATAFAARVILRIDPQGGLGGVTARDLQKSLSSTSARLVFARTPAYVLYSIFIAQLGLFLISIFVGKYHFM
jgi:hypothetical protein